MARSIPAGWSIAALLALVLCTQLTAAPHGGLLPRQAAAAAGESTAGADAAAPDAPHQQDDAAPPPDEEHGEEGEPAPPEGVKRQRPRTENEERAYKMRKTREDPFLSPPQGGGQDLSAYYNPRDYIAPLAKGYTARYMIQDAAGTMQGYLLLSVDLRTESSRNDTVYVSALYSNEPRTEVRLWLDSASLTPRRLERRTLRDQRAPAPGTAPAPATEGDRAGGPVQDERDAAAPVSAPDVIPGDPSQWSPEDEPPRLNADYLFDRVTIRHSSGMITVQRVLRQLPNSFELESMPVLVRQIDCRAADWPFEAALTDARHLRSVPLSIEEPGWSELLSAEPLHYRCRDFVLRLGQQQLHYYVQSTPPYKLVQFTDGVYTYTLFEYASR